MMFENTIFKCNRAGRKALSVRLVSAEPFWIELAALSGFDCVSLDGEHGAYSPVEVDRIVSVAHAHGLTVKARVPNHSADEINRWLDRGLQGIMAPHIETGGAGSGSCGCLLLRPSRPSVLGRRPRHGVQ